MCDDGEHMYCGTTSGDVMLVNINTCLLKQFGPQKDKYSQVYIYMYVIIVHVYIVIYPLSLLSRA